MPTTLAHIKLDNVHVWVNGLPGDTASRVWVIDNDGDLALDVKLSASPPRPRSEAIEHLRKAGYSIVEVVTPTLFVVEKS
jgi:DNA repair photolyase